MKLSDIEEIHQYIKDNYKYGNDILYSKERSLNDLQLQTLYWAYVKNKYNRRVYRISSEFYDISRVNRLQGNNKRLFVINTSSRNYNPFLFRREKNVLEKLFPTKTKYEIDFEGVINDDSKLISKKLINSINDLMINKINNNITFYSRAFLKEIGLEQIINVKEQENEYKRLLEEEIQYMKNQCFWQEKINFMIFIFFI